MIVSNTSPLYYLHQVDLLSLLGQVFRCIYTTPQVVEELEAARRQGLHVPDLSQEKWCTVQEIAVPAFLGLVTDLGRGEASVLALALEHEGSYAIIDDSLGRQVALAEGIRLTGTLGVLLQAKKQGLVSEISTVVEDLIRSGFYCSPHLKTHILQLAGETSTHDPLQ